VSEVPTEEEKKTALNIAEMTPQKSEVSSKEINLPDINNKSKQSISI
jgi:hypothetical protein